MTFPTKESVNIQSREEEYSADDYEEDKTTGPEDDARQSAVCDHAYDEDKLVLPRWMRYLPNTPWKHSSNLNLGVKDDKERLRVEEGKNDTEVGEHFHDSFRNDTSKRRKARENPYSTSEIKMARHRKHIRDDVDDGDVSCKSSPFKRRRIYVSSEAGSIEEASALFSFCKFKK